MCAAEVVTAFQLAKSRSDTRSGRRCTVFSHYPHGEPSVSPLGLGRLDRFPHHIVGLRTVVRLIGVASTSLRRFVLVSNFLHPTKPRLDQEYPAFATPPW